MQNCKAPEELAAFLLEIVFPDLGKINPVRIRQFLCFVFRDPEWGGRVVFCWPTEDPTLIPTASPGSGPIPPLLHPSTSSLCCIGLQHLLDIGVDEPALASPCPLGVAVHEMVGTQTLAAACHQERVEMGH